MKRALLVFLVLILGGLAFGRASPYRVFTFQFSGFADINYPCPRSRPACLTAGWNFELAVGNYPNDYGTAAVTMTNNGAATRVNDGTWPFAGGLVTGTEGFAWNLDGAADYLSRLDDGTFDMDLTNNPGGDFSVQCVMSPYDITAGTGTIIGKWAAVGNQRSWIVYRNADDAVMSISNNGAATTVVTANNVLSAYRPAFITATYNWITSGTSEVRIYTDNSATTQSNVAIGPVYDSTSPFLLGGNAVWPSMFDGLIHDCKVYKGIVITEAQHDEMFARFQGRASTSTPGVYAEVASASPPAIPMSYPASGTEPFLVDQPANSSYIGSPASGSGGIYGATALTSKWWRGSCETADGANHCQGWTTAENQGGGAATVVVDQITTSSAHAGASVLFTADGGGVPKHAYIDGACQTNWIAQDVSLIVWGITLTGTANCSVQLLEYDTAVCGTLLATNTVWGAGNPGANWTQLEGTVLAATWNGATSSWQPRIRCDETGTAYTAAFDAAMALQEPNTFHTDVSCTTDADADAVCNTMIISIDSPFTANGQFTAEGTWRSPSVGLPALNIWLFTDGNAANANTYASWVSTITGDPIWAVYDNAAAVRSNSPNVLNWAADTDYTVRMRTGGNDNLGLYWNAAWDNTVGGAGNGTRAAAQATTYLNGTQITGTDVWLHTFRVFGRMIE